MLNLGPDGSAPSDLTSGLLNAKQDVFAEFVYEALGMNFELQDAERSLIGAKGIFAALEKFMLPGHRPYAYNDVYNDLPKGVLEKISYLSEEHNISYKHFSLSPLSSEFMKSGQMIAVVTHVLKNKANGRLISLKAIHICNNDNVDELYKPVDAWCEETRFGQIFKNAELEINDYEEVYDSNCIDVFISNKDFNPPIGNILRGRIIDKCLSHVNYDNGEMNFWGKLSELLSVTSVTPKDLLDFFENFFPKVLPEVEEINFSKDTEVKNLLYAFIFKCMQVTEDGLSMSFFLSNISKAEGLNGKGNLFICKLANKYRGEEELIDYLVVSRSGAEGETGLDRLQFDCFSFLKSKDKLTLLDNESDLIAVFGMNSSIDEFTIYVPSDLFTTP